MELLWQRISGVDFSGAQDAGRKIFVAGASVVDGVLCIEDCRAAKDLPNSGLPPERCLQALRHFIAGAGNCVFGLDFPFGLPRTLVTEATWEEFVLCFGRKYSSPEEFREACLRCARGRELKRSTDQESRTPFSPYNLRLYRQTFFGISELLAPLVRQGLVSVLPMQSAIPGRPWLVEICPASFLEQEDLDRHPYRPYKGKTRARHTARELILKRLEIAHDLSIESLELRGEILGNSEGDALDAVLGGLVAFRASQNKFRIPSERKEEYALEGYVYV